MRNNVFMHIPQALAMGNITLQVSEGSGTRGVGRQPRLFLPSISEVLGWGPHRCCVTGFGPSSTHGCGWGSSTPQP